MLASSTRRGDRGVRNASPLHAQSRPKQALAGKAFIQVLKKFIDK